MHEAKPTLIALVAAVAVLSGATLVAPTAAQEPADPYVHIPTTISEAWQAQLRQYPNPDGMNAFPPGDDVEAWGRLQGMMEEALGADYDAVLESNGATAQRRTIGGVPVLEVRPRDWEDNGKLLVYVHGGAYTLGSVVSTVGSAVYGAEATGLRVISIDYTLTPQARWRQITDEVVAVFAGLEDEGVAFDDIAIFGNDQMCYIKRSDVWKITGYIGQGNPQ